MFIMYKMAEKQINIKNRICFFYNGIINIKTFDARLLKIDKKSYKDIGIYNIGYITKKKIDDCQNIYSVNLLYLIIANVSGYIEDSDSLYLNIDHANGYTKEEGMNKCLVYDSKDENKDLLNVMMFQMELKRKSKM